MAALLGVLSILMTQQQKVVLKEPAELSPARTIRAPRLCSYDRFGIYITIIAKLVGLQLPPNYLHERALNVAWILSQYEGTLKRLNEVLKRYTKTEAQPPDSLVLKPEWSPKPYPPWLVSDTAIRLLYYLAALLSNNAVDIFNITLDPVVMPEEPNPTCRRYLCLTS